MLWQKTFYTYNTNIYFLTNKWMLFKDLDLIDPILKALEKKWYEKPTPIQEKSIPHILKGRDLLLSDLIIPVSDSYYDKVKQDLFS